MWRCYSAPLLTLLLSTAGCAGMPEPEPAFARSAPTLAAAAQDSTVLGRWDLTLRTPEGEKPSWLEIRRSGHRTHVGRFVGVVGSARPISRVEVSGDRFRFSIPPQWEEGTGDLSVEGRLQDGRLAGTLTFPDGRRHEWSAVRAPALRREAAPRWGKPVRLFNGRDLAGWRVLHGESRWQVADGVLRNTGSGGNLATEQAFGDFKLHLEFRYPEGSNSGVYLRGRHEVQIQDDHGKEPADDRFGGVYGFLAPSEMAARRPGEWQTYDITLVGRMVTVVANGKTVIYQREIPGITGGALDSNEGAPGPLLLQGDHGPVEFRDITLTPAR